jgi:hypothetical protein
LDVARGEWWQVDLTDLALCPDLVRLAWSRHEEPGSRRVYAYSWAYVDGQHVMLKQHRLVAALMDRRIGIRQQQDTVRGLIIDHIGTRPAHGYDNRRANLRILEGDSAGSAQMANRGTLPTKSGLVSVYDGVTKSGQDAVFRARVKQGKLWKNEGHPLEIGAALLVMKTPAAEMFRSGRDFAAWIGLTPKDHSTAGKARLGVITRAGDEALRSVLVVGATSVVRQARNGRGDGALAAWLTQLLKRKAPKLVAVALANKMARIAWKLLASGQAYARKTAMTAPTAA